MLRTKLCCVRGIRLAAEQTISYSSHLFALGHNIATSSSDPRLHGTVFSHLSPLLSLGVLVVGACVRVFFFRRRASRSSRRSSALSSWARSLRSRCTPLCSPWSVVWPLPPSRSSPSREIELECVLSMVHAGSGCYCTVVLSLCKFYFYDSSTAACSRVCATCSVVEQGRVRSA